jgi:GNAT superfamily N-acetyltransferase
MECSAFTPADVPAAARLVAGRVRTLRAETPELPAAWGVAGAWEARIAAMAADGAAVAAHEADRLVGFLAAELDHDHARAFSPEWANATIPGGRRVLEALYSAAASRWVADGLRTHVVGALAGQADDAAALDWLGFGAIVVDAVRGVDPLPKVGAAVTVRRATVDDLDTVVALEDGLRRHLSASPVFLVLPPPRRRDEHRSHLADPALVTLLAEDDGAAVAHLRIGPCADDVATVVRDPGTASITGAFTLADRRAGGVATTLLEAAVAWARDAGFARCAVDFESANLEAARFWTRWFRPVTTWRIRRLHSLAGTVAE